MTEQYSRNQFFNLGVLWGARGRGPGVAVFVLPGNARRGPARFDQVARIARISVGTDGTPAKLSSFFLNVEIRGSTLTGPAVQCAVTYAYPTLRYAVCSSGTYPPKRTTASLNNSIEVYLKKLFQIKIIPSRKHHL